MSASIHPRVADVVVGGVEAGGYDQQVGSEGANGGQDALAKARHPFLAAPAEDAAAAAACSTFAAARLRAGAVEFIVPVSLRNSLAPAAITGRGVPAPSPRSSPPRRDRHVDDGLMQIVLRPRPGIKLYAGALSVVCEVNGTKHQVGLVPFRHRASARFPPFGVPRSGDLFRPVSVVHVEVDDGDASYGDRRSLERALRLSRRGTNVDRFGVSDGVERFAARARKRRYRDG